MGLTSFTHYFYQHPFPTASVKFTVKDLLPSAEIKLAVGDGHHDFASHDLAFHVGVGIVFADVVAVSGHRFMGSDLFQPDLVIVVKS